MAKTTKNRSPGILATDPMAEAIRKILRFHLGIMLDHEAESRSGKDIEDVHDMRVATRRMRAAFRLFGTYFEKKATRQFRDDLRETGRALGGVRDLDVFNWEAQKYLAGPGQGQDLTPLLESWRQQREAAQGRFIAFLDSERYQGFAADFCQFVESEGAGVKPIAPPAPFQVRHTLPSSIWRFYETALAYETLFPDASPETLHALRIECKHLRYTLEFFREVLGPESNALIKDVVFVQDHLGNLQDAVVASALLKAFLKDWRKRAEKDPTNDLEPLAGVEAYRKYRQDEAARLIKTFPKAWRRLRSRNFRQRLSAALLAL